jgi:hypothetical protein
MEAACHSRANALRARGITHTRQIGDIGTSLSVISKGRVCAHYRPLARIAKIVLSSISVADKHANLDIPFWKVREQRRAILFRRKSLLI